MMGNLINKRKIAELEEKIKVLTKEKEQALEKIKELEKSHKAIEREFYNACDERNALKKEKETLEEDLKYVRKQLTDLTDSNSYSTVFDEYLYGESKK